TLHVTPAPLAITADDQSKLYGASLPVLTAGSSGLVNGDTPASLTTPQILSTTAAVTSPAGDYPITVSGASSLDYTITFVSGTLHILPVTSGNSPPTANSDSLTTYEDQSVSGNVLTNDTDPDAGDTLNVVAVNGNAAPVGQRVTTAHGTV